MTDEELQEIADVYGLYTEQDVKNRLSCELLRIGARNEELEQQIKKMKRCEICKHNGIKTCQYDNGIKDCLENGRKLFELKEIKENE